jgi:glutamate formiminotransferase/formiminotetrahydrofolate cyclodeaminase
MSQIIECVPNFSEGNNINTINQIAEAISSVKGVKLLHTDIGMAANRTVYTFAGSPDDVIEAVFRGAKKAVETINMTEHTGEHPRFGALDVCPLIPISDISMEETIVYARKLAKRLGEELGIHVYCYGEAAYINERKNLAYCRSGGYEGLQNKLQKPEWKPDFGPLTFNQISGASAVGARNFLIAYNINLNTTSVQIAKAIANEVRESGYVKREDDKSVRDENNKVIRVPGLLKTVKAIGWYIEDFGIAQVSMNLTDINTVPMHIAFDEVCKAAVKHGVNVTGSEIIGLVPLNSLLEAGRFFLNKKNQDTILPENELVKIAIDSLGLNELYKFDPNEKIFEYVLRSK